MNKEEYKKIVGNTLEYHLSGHNLQHIINSLKKSGIATYNDSAEKGVIIEASDSKWDRVKKCLEKDESTIYEIEKMYIDKSYRYSIFFQCDKFDLNDKLSKYINIKSFKVDKLQEIGDFLLPRYFENEEMIVFIFYKVINPYIAKIDKSKHVLYNTLWIYHKELNILEHRFDILGFKSNDEFYHTTFNAQLDILIQDFRIKAEEFRTSTLIEYIVDNKKREVHEISKYMGLKGNSSAKLKVGNNLVMPFIGDLELIMSKYDELLEKTSDTKRIKEILQKYIVETKENANYKSRLLAWYNYNEDKYFLNVNIIFSYRNKKYDLFNFLEPKKNSMELMNYAIQYICGIRGDIPNNK
ncbi:hypothetical protein [Clostridium sp. HBUAS56017]|uniref:hypothetical protein n=1 Tax=Clostridium sp. HBUAS56017 TaxID=2571128 RepID=UPI00117858ED|nr:hypothetical protein [Clostridium sp. HBUAS56017]